VFDVENNPPPKPEPSKESLQAKDNLINHLGELYAAAAPKPVYDPYASVFKTSY